MSEREVKTTEERLNEWKAIYDIPKHLEFDYKALAQLEEQYEKMSNVNPEHVRTRSELLSMIHDLKRKSCQFNKKKIVDGYGFAIIGNSINHIVSRLVEIINKQDIKLERTNGNIVIIELLNGMKIYVVTKDNLNLLRGHRFLEYWNLTCDIEIEKQLSSMRTKNAVIK